MFFSEILQRHLPAGRDNLTRRMALLDYQDELKAKNHALAEFWKAHRLTGTPAPLLASPRERYYRTTTKRHASVQLGRFSLRFSQASDSKRESFEYEALLEPKEHTRLYAFISEKLQEPFFKPLAHTLNFVILRGSYSERSVILNTRELSARIVKCAKILSQRLPEFDPGVKSVFLFLDPKNSRFYLDTGPVEGFVKTKTISGPDKLYVNFAGHAFKFPPTVFSQVNESMVPLMLNKARELLRPDSRQQLIDLYCGYGLFALTLAPFYQRTFGLEGSGASVRSAQENIRLHPQAKKTAFFECTITGKNLLAPLPAQLSSPEVVICDPPRQGMPPAAISTLCARKPVKVLEACCGIDEIPRQSAVWQSNGYRITSVAPLDMFAGTPHLEILILLEPKENRHEFKR